MSRRVAAISFLALGGLTLSGCSSTTLDTNYGHVRGKSINGTGALAELFREQGHEVRAAVRLTDELNEWADVIVRFAPYPGPPEREEAGWYFAWLRENSRRQMIYVPCDYDAESDYWSAVLDRLPQDIDPKLRALAEKRRGNTRNWTDRVPKDRPKEVADPREWFAVELARRPPLVCKTLVGPWARGIDPSRATLSVHDALKVETETVYLDGDGAPLAMARTLEGGSQVLVITNGSFLLNAPLANPARRPLALRVVYWVGKEPARVAFVEGRSVLREGGLAFPSMWDIFVRLAPFRWVVIQMAVLGLFACLARAPRLGRPRPEPPSGADRPAAHPEALGALLARTGSPAEARAILDAYRKWRYPSRAGQPSSVVSPQPSEKGEKPPEIEFLET